VAAPSKILVDCSNLHYGGAMQVARSFLWHASRDRQNRYDYSFVVHEALAKQCPWLSDVVYQSTESPLRDSKVAQAVLASIDSVKPDLVYSIFGPTVQYTRCPHICGLANAWVSHALISDFFRSSGVLAGAKKWAVSKVLGYKVRRYRHIIFETAIARATYCHRFRYPIEQTSVVSNTIPSSVDLVSEPPNLADAMKVQVLCLASYYPHKNLESIPRVACLLKQQTDRRFVFQLTLDPEIYRRHLLPLVEKLEVADAVVNLGPIPVSGLQSLYAKAHIVYQSSLLETFSAVYAEGLATRRYLLLHDQPAARVVCGDAGIYVNSQNSNSVCQAVLGILAGQQQNVFDHYDEALEKLPSPIQKYQACTAVFDQTLAQGNSE
jgi:glycosyltransferase involved in cell wall biosynthesis